MDHLCLLLTWIISSQHGAATTSSGTGGFTITVTSSDASQQYTTGTTIDLNLGGTYSYEGFLLRATDSATGQGIGSFSAPSGTTIPTSATDCSGDANSKVVLRLLLFCFPTLL